MERQSLLVMSAVLVPSSTSRPRDAFYQIPWCRNGKKDLVHIQPSRWQYDSEMIPPYGMGALCNWPYCAQRGHREHPGVFEIGCQLAVHHPCQDLKKLPSLRKVGCRFRWQYLDTWCSPTPLGEMHCHHLQLSEAYRSNKIITDYQGTGLISTC